MKKTNTPKISILIATYNKEKFLEEAIVSALSQDYPNLEVIVSDDCSSDNSPQIAKKYLKDKRFKYFRNKKNLGRVGNHRKALFDYATGDYVLNLDADDYLIDNQYLSEAISLILKHDLIFVFSMPKVLIQKKNKFIFDKINRNLPTIIDGNSLFIGFHKGYSFFHLTVLFNRKKALEIDAYKHDIINDDWECFLRMMLNNKLGFIDKFIGVWRKHSENESKSLDLDYLVKNTQMIKTSYQYALKKKIFSKKDLDLWGERMLKRYFFKTLVKILVMERKNYRKMLHKIKRGYPQIHKLIIQDPKFFMIKSITLNKIVTGFIFKNILKIESFYEDLIQ